VRPGLTHLRAGRVRSPSSHSPQLVVKGFVLSVIEGMENSAELGYGEGCDSKILLRQIDRGRSLSQKELRIL
jgi:hypothetical protein